MDMIPHLHEIAKHIDEVAAETPVNEVISIFRSDPTLLAIPVVDKGRFLALMSRKNLFSGHLNRPFAMDLLGKRPIRELLDDRIPTMEPDRDINVALARLLELDPTLEADSFALSVNGEYRGVVTVPDLMMKHAESQALLLETLQKMSARIRDEVETASRIQQALLPPQESRFESVTVSACLATSSEIGGDIYDYFPINEGKLGLVIGDVSGHGVQSGMVTTAAKASLHTLIDQGVDTPAALLHGMNNAILATARQTLLMTCLIAVIDTAAGRVTLANAGHNFPFLYQREPHRIEMLKDVSGYPLGFEQNNTYEELSFPFTDGDILFLYSDGIVECTDGQGNEFGYKRLEEFIREHLHLSPREMKERLVELASCFTGDRTFEDDVTILIAASNAHE